MVKFPKRSVVLAAAAMLLWLAGCGPGAPAAQPPAAAEPAAAEPAEADAAAETAEEEVVEIEAAEETEQELAGEIVISIQSNDVQTYQALADAYMAKHPDVTVLVELKAPGGEDAYLQWIKTQFAAGTPRVSIIETPHVRDLIQEGRIVNLAPYLNQVNPYTGKNWEESFEEWGLNLVRDPNTGEMYILPYMSVQTFWVYNKDIFEEVGITDVPPQPTWDQFVEWAEKLKAAGYIPISTEGTIDQIWGGGQMPWQMRSAMDQYHRDDINLVRCQEGDWCFREGIDDVWTYDPTDPRNDDPDRVSINVVRHLIALRDQQIRFDTECTVEMMEQLGRIYKTENGFVPEGWLGMPDGYPLFLTQRAAMRQDTGRVYTQLEKDIAALAEGAYADPSAVSEEDAKAATTFEFGTFAFPTIEGPCVQGKARANELTAGYLSIPKKDRAQNDLEIDFLMFWTSPEGMQIFLGNKLDPNNLQGGVQGPPLIKDVALPDPWQEIFDNATFIGNYEKPGAPGDAVARGFYFYEPTKREWAIMVQEFFSGAITAEEFAQRYQKLLEDNWDGLLEYLNVTPEDLEHPEKRPPGWVAGGPY